MDSLTQIVLGAAVGEVVLGKKIGNRAMLLGAIGGTIPDMDVMGQFFLSEIDNLAFHRGATISWDQHSNHGPYTNHDNNLI